MNENLYNNLIGKKLSGEISATEEAQLNAWTAEQEANQAEFDATKTIWDETQTPSFEVDTDTAWSKFEGKMAWDEADTPEVSSTKVVSISPWKQLLQIAAVLLLVSSVGYWWIQNNGETSNLASILTQDNERIEVSLPDGSKVWLNERSSLTYNKEFTSRNVNLKGEAFFDIVRDEAKPFRIQAGKTETKVLGTSFNVRAYESESSVEVSVSTGKVAFSENIANLESLILTKGERGILNKESWSLEKNKPVNENANSWRTGNIAFKNASMKNVITDLERHYNTKFDLTEAAIKDCKFTGGFTDTPLQEVLDAISFALDLNVQKKDMQYIISGNGCQATE